MNHKDLDAWKKAVDFVTLIYKITSSFPDGEKFGLTSQIRRASVSVPSNIAEGAAKNSDKEFIHFLYIALGSTSEIETQLIISQNLGFIKNVDNIQSELTEIRKLIKGLINFLKKK